MYAYTYVCTRIYTNSLLALSAIRFQLTLDGWGGSGGNGLSSWGGAGGRTIGGGNPDVFVFISLKMLIGGGASGMGGGGLSSIGKSCGFSGSLGGTSPPS